MGKWVGGYGGLKKAYRGRTMSQKNFDDEPRLVSSRLRRSQKLEGVKGEKEERTRVGCKRLRKVNGLDSTTASIRPLTTGEICLSYIGY